MAIMPNRPASLQPPAWGWSRVRFWRPLFFLQQAIHGALASWIHRSNTEQIKPESVDCYLGLAILEKVFINIVLELDQGEDPYCIPTEKKDNPPIDQVYHDVSDKAEAIIKNGLELVATSLPEFIREA